MLNLYDYEHKKVGHVISSYTEKFKGKGQIIIIYKKAHNSQPSHRQV